MEPITGMLIMVAVLGVMAVLTTAVMKWTRTDPAEAADQALEPSLTPRTSLGLDPLERGLTDAAEFDEWVKRFLNPTYLDGRLVKSGEGVDVYFKTQADGRIVLQSIVI
jgi:hypothetical protein